ncbi:MAG TPA: glycosyltransferase, partial [Pseudobdellovibrionaceae bacterium]|nr:glycosyltransferase [Pseudobdellovibrionaceae bacterium]
MKNLVIIPTYNEKENIAVLIPELMGMNLNIDILVVDDNSPDGTAQVVELLMKEHSRVHI